MSNVSDENPDAPDEALLGPGSTATGGGTSQGSVPESAEGEDHIRPLNRPNVSTDSADDADADEA